MRIFVVDKHKKPRIPCLSARARELLRKKKAAIFRLYPFTIILLNIDPKSRGGSNRISNLTISCRPCNEKKSNDPIEKFLKKSPKILLKILAKKKASLRDTAYVGTTGQNIDLSEITSVLKMEAKGRGARQMCRPDRYRFPGTSAKIKKRVIGFQTGDLVISIVLKGKKLGTHFGRVAVRSSGNFNIKTSLQTVQGVNAEYFERFHLTDEYEYSFCKEATIPPWPKDQGLHAVI